MTKLEKLVMRQAELIKLIREKKAEVTGYCKKRHDGCIAHIIKLKDEMNKGSGGGMYADYYSFHEVFCSVSGEDEPCDHCKQVISNKIERTPLVRELGRARSSVSRIGLVMLKRQENNV